MTEWNRTGEIDPCRWTCGYCGSQVGGNIGYNKLFPDRDCIYICPSCGNPTAFVENGLGRLLQVPGSMYGSDVSCLPQSVSKLYREVRECFKGGAFTASVLAARKLLMHIAVDCGADEGKSFIQYVEFLSVSGYIPPNGKGWVDEIRKRSNEANHEIVIMDSDDARRLIDFCEMLLRFVYEFPAMVEKK